VIITTRNLLQYLLAKRLVCSESAVDGDFTVINVSGRNRNFKVLRKDSASYFIKQIQFWDVQSVAMLQCEAACYWLARNDRDFASLIPLTPEFYSYDPERQIIITGLITNGEDLWSHFRRLRKIPADMTAELGALLGTYHSQTGSGLTESPQSGIFPRSIPWILSPERRNSHPFKQLSPATVELFDFVERSVELCSALEELRNNWKTSTLMHGDLKMENCIVSRNDSDSKINFTIVDWELADIGDPCWDIASILQSFLSARIMCLPPGEVSLSFRDVMTHPSHAGLTETILSFWKQYVEKLRIEAGTSQKLFERCLRFGAARMIQSAYEYMQFSTQLSTNALHLLEVSTDLLTNSAYSVEQLLRSDS
jgi:hypothetical protein